MNALARLILSEPNLLRAHLRRLTKMKTIMVVDGHPDLRLFPSLRAQRAAQHSTSAAA